MDMINWKSLKYSEKILSLNILYICVYETSLNSLSATFNNTYYYILHNF